jgi:hypothetical protein
MAAIGRRRDAFLLFEGPLPRKEDLVTLWRRTKRVRQKIKDMVFKDTLCFSLLLCEKNIFIDRVKSRASLLSPGRVRVREECDDF